MGSCGGQRPQIGASKSSHGIVVIYLSYFRRLSPFFNTFHPRRVYIYIYSAASHASCPDGVLIFRDFHKVLK
jgi:hypothetical protein